MFIRTVEVRVGCSLFFQDFEAELFQFVLKLSRCKQTLSNMQQ